MVATPTIPGAAPAEKIPTATTFNDTCIICEVLVSVTGDMGKMLDDILEGLRVTGTVFMPVDTVETLKTETVEMLNGTTDLLNDIMVCGRIGLFA